MIIMKTHVVTIIDFLLSLFLIIGYCDINDNFQNIDNTLQI